jgi:hypothetical protein
MKKIISYMPAIIKKLLYFAMISILCTSIFAGCSKKQTNPGQSDQTASSDVTSDANKGITQGDMVLYSSADYEFYYPSEWADMVKHSDDIAINLYNDGSNYVDFVVGKMEYASVEEAVKQYKSAAVVSFESVKTNTGEDLYLAENSVAKGINFTAYVFDKNIQYELRASMTYDFYNKNIELVKKVAKTIHIRDRNGINSSSTQEQQSSSDSNQNQSSGVKAELQKLEQTNIGSKNFIKVGEIEDKLLNESGGELTYDIDTLYTAAYTLLSGLTSGNKDILTQCVYDSQNGLSKLTTEVPAFASEKIAPYVRDFKIYVVDNDKVYIDLKSPKDDMQFYIKFNKISGKYYFDSFIQK